MAALPLAEKRVSGPAFLTAVAVGYDVGRRVLEGFGGYVPHNQAGWRSTGTCGVFAAAAASASLLRLDARATASCLGLAASFASGIWAFIHDGAMTKRVHAGRAAEGGLLAALLAGGGLTGPRHTFDDLWGGFYRTYGHGPLAPERVTRDLGRDWLLRQAATKPHASCRDAHAAIDALGRVIAREALSPDTVLHIRARLNPFLDGMVGGRDVGTLAGAQMSLPYALAVRLHLGTASLPAYAEAHRRSPAILEAMSRVTIEIDGSVTASWASSLVVEFADGRRIEEPTSLQLGSPDNPLPPQALRAKYDELAALALPRRQADDLAETILGLEDAADARSLLPLLSTTAGSSRRLPQKDVGWSRPSGSRIGEE